MNSFSNLSENQFSQSINPPANIPRKYAASISLDAYDERVGKQLNKRRKSVSVVEPDKYQDFSCQQQVLPSHIP
jgi:hypothetical protein